MALLANRGLATRGPASRGPVRQRVASSEHFTGWAFVTPAALIIGLFGVVPIVWSALLSFQKNNLLTPDTPFVGTANYRQMVHDPVVAQAIQHTLVYTVLFVPGTMVVGLFLAVAMNRKIRFISLYRTAAYATVAISTISEAIVFIWLFDPSYGVINYFLSRIGRSPVCTAKYLSCVAAVSQIRNCSAAAVRAGPLLKMTQLSGPEIVWCPPLVPG